MSTSSRELITLTATEEQLFNLLLSQTRRRSVTIRVAGGWVRDKLLASIHSSKFHYSEDVDLAIDTMSGEEFAKLIGYPFIGNPGQSEHLASVVINFKDLGISVDANRMRKETYRVDSRIPEIEPGSPLDDTKRRDFTINSLYYNIHSKEIEDFMECGVKDLKDGLIRTPKDALESFDEDPLRILRAIRFAARFEFRLDESILTAIDEKKHLILEKVSRERISEEILKCILLYPDWKVALRILHILQDLKLFELVFQVPKLDSVSGKPFKYLPVDFSWNRENIERSISLVGKLVALSSSKPKLHRSSLLAAIFWPMREFQYEFKKSKLRPLPELVLQQSLKLPNKSMEETGRILDSAARFVEVIQKISFPAQEPFTEFVVTLGHIIYESKELWKSGFDLARVVLEDDSKDSFENLERWILLESGLNDIWHWKPLFDGKRLMQVLNVKGPQVGELLKLQLSWRFMNPEGSEAQLLEFLKHKMSTL